MLIVLIFDIFFYLKCNLDFLLNGCVRFRNVIGMMKIYIIDILKVLLNCYF